MNRIPDSCAAESGFSAQGGVTLQECLAPQKSLSLGPCGGRWEDFFSCEQGTPVRGGSLFLRGSCLVGQGCVGVELSSIGVWNIVRTYFLYLCPVCRENTGLGK